MRFAKLTPFLRTPRQVSPQLEQITGKPFFFLPWAVNSWKRRMQNAPLVEAAVVQANPALYNAETATWAPVVVCFCVDQRSVDGRSAAALAQQLAAIRDGRLPDPCGGRIQARLLNEESRFYEALLPPFGPGAYWATEYVDPARLPNGCLQADAVLPALVDPSEEYFELIPPSLWM